MSSPSDTTPDVSTSSVSSEGADEPTTTPEIDPAEGEEEEGGDEGGDEGDGDDTEDTEDTDEEEEEEEEETKTHLPVGAVVLKLIARDGARWELGRGIPAEEAEVDPNNKVDCGIVHIQDFNPDSLDEGAYRVYALPTQGSPFHEKAVGAVVDLRKADIAFTIYGVPIDALFENLQQINPEAFLRLMQRLVDAGTAASAPEG